MPKILLGVLLMLSLSLAWVDHDVAWIPPAQAQTAADGLAAQRTGLTQALGLKPAQQHKLDAILAQAEPKLAAVAALPVTQQAVARRKLLDDMHLRINEMLTPDQRATYELMQAKAEERRNGQVAGGSRTAVPAK